MYREAKGDSDSSVASSESSCVELVVGDCGAGSVALGVLILSGVPSDASAFASVEPSSAGVLPEVFASPVVVSSVGCSSARHLRIRKANKKNRISVEESILGALDYVNGNEAEVFTELAGMSTGTAVR